MKKDTQMIIRRMDAIKIALLSLGVDERVAGEVALHLAELTYLLAGLLAVVETACNGRPLPRNDLVELSEELDFHAPYHLAYLRRSLRKIGKSLCLETGPRACVKARGRRTPKKAR
jgi:hypothetical protein